MLVVRKTRMLQIISGLLCGYLRILSELRLKFFWERYW
jgi:hypothetical protein